MLCGVFFNNIKKKKKEWFREEATAPADGRNASCTGRVPHMLDLTQFPPHVGITNLILVA